LKGADLEQAQNALAAILEVLGRTDSGIHGASFAGGATGVSLLFAYQSVALGEPRTGRSRTLALDLMDRALNQAHLLGGNPGLFSGYSGLGWTLDHFRHMGLIHEDADLNQELDEALLVFLDPGTWRGLPELVDGLAGIGIYALDRNGEGRAEALLERVLILLSAKVERHMDGLAWYDDPELLYLEARNAMPDGLFNLGVSHGNPGVAGFLAGAAKLSASAQGLLDGAIRWLLAQKEAHEDGSQYGAGYGRHDRSRNPRRFPPCLVLWRSWDRFGAFAGGSQPEQLGLGAGGAGARAGLLPAARPLSDGRRCRPLPWRLRQCPPVQSPVPGFR
jgi:hypothetical protein